MSAPDTPRDPFDVLRATCAEILATQHAREPGPAAPLLADAPRPTTATPWPCCADAWMSSTRRRRPRPRLSRRTFYALPSSSSQTADGGDDGERRETVVCCARSLDPPPPAPPAPVTVRNVTGDPPAPVLSIPRHDGRRDGAVLSVGTVALLAGAGGAAKTTLALQIALAAAATTDGADREACGGALIVAAVRWWGDPTRMRCGAPGSRAAHGRARPPGRRTGPPASARPGRMAAVRPAGRLRLLGTTDGGRRMGAPVVGRRGDRRALGDRRSGAGSVHRREQRGRPGPWVHRRPGGARLPSAARRCC